GDDLPAILGPNLRRVIGHRAEAIGDHIKEVTERRFPEPILMKGRRTAIAAAYHHAVALSGPAVARRAEHVEPLASTRHDTVVDWKRKHGGVRAVDLAGVKQRVFTQLPARDGARHERPGRSG